MTEGDAFGKKNTREKQLSLTVKSKVREKQQKKLWKVSGKLNVTESLIIGFWSDRVKNKVMSSSKTLFSLI